MNPDGSWIKGTPIWRLGDSSFTLYPIMMFLGILMSFLTVCYFWKRQKYPWEILQIILIIAVPTAIFGARLWYAFFNPDAWSQFFYFSGLSIQGGVIFSSIAVLIYLYFVRHAVDIRTVVGMILPAILIGQFIGRIGNFTNHEVYGPIVSKESLNWLAWIGIQSNMFIDGYYHAPFFLYEMFGTLSAYIIIVWVLLYRNYVMPGVTGGLYLLIYGVIRVIMEPLRDASDIMLIGSWQISTIISVLIVVLGIFLIIWWQFLTRPFYSWVEKNLKKSFLHKITKEYELIRPIKPRRKYLWFGHKMDTRLKYTFFGKRVANHVRLWIPAHTTLKWSKREINANKKNKPKSSKSKIANYKER